MTDSAGSSQQQQQLYLLFFSSLWDSWQQARFHAVKESRTPFILIDMTTLANADIDIATRGADQFVRLYYEAYDSKDRLDLLPKFYRPASSLVWNGNPVQGVEGVQKLLEGMPSSRHEVQSFDCHPIPGTTPPSLLLTVCGTVIHGPAALVHPTTIASKSVDSQPRIFTQTFTLAPDSEKSAEDPSTSVKYYVNTDALRFVG